MTRALLKRCGRFVRDARQTLGLTQAQLAKRCRVPTIYLRALERGEVNPGLGALVAAARGLKMEPGSMLTTMLASSIDADVRRPKLDRPKHRARDQNE